MSYDRIDICFFTALAIISIVGIFCLVGGVYHTETQHVLIIFIDPRGNEERFISDGPAQCGHNRGTVSFRNYYNGERISLQGSIKVIHRISLPIELPDHEHQFQDVR
jgi:hypothetical protein